FQAEDGIRDKLVTGVQTCALPISAMWAPPPLHREAARFGNANVRAINLVASNIPGPPMPLYLGGTRLVAYYPLLPLGANSALSRSEERRVGKEGRYAEAPEDSQVR